MLMTFTMMRLVLLLRLVVLLSASAEDECVVRRKNRSILFWGERNSGTRWAEGLIRRNLVLKNIDRRRLNPTMESSEQKYPLRPMRTEMPWSWKHACAISRGTINGQQKPSLQDQTADVQDVVFVTLSKNPYAWLVSMFHRPYYHGAAKSMAFSQFIQAPFPAQTSREPPAYSRRREQLRRQQHEHHSGLDDALEADRDLENYWGSCRRHHRGHRESLCLCSVCAVPRNQSSSAPAPAPAPSPAPSLAPVEAAPTSRAGRAAFRAVQNCHGSKRRHGRPAFASPVEMWNIKQRSYLALRGNLSTTNIRYEDLLRHPDRAIEAIATMHCIARKNAAFNNREDHVKGAPNLARSPHLRGGNFSWHKRSRAGLISQYADGGWKDFYRSGAAVTATTTKDLLAQLNAQLDAVVMKLLEYEYWWG